jgi:predicted dehydrogenase
LARALGVAELYVPGGGIGVLRAAVIGLGVGERHIAGYESDPRCEVVALCDVDPVKLQEVGSRHPGRRLTAEPLELLDDASLDVVSIASYDDAHRDQVLRAIEAGKHVFVEKPLCLLRREFEEIALAKAAQPNVSLSSNLILRRTPRFRALRDRLRGGELGEPYYLEGSYDYGRLQKITEGWRSQIPFYSVVHGGAIHLIDLLLWMTRETVEEVHAFGNRISTKGTQFRHPDLVAALLRFSNGMVAKITANFGSVTPHCHELKVYGTKGTFLHGHTGAAYLWSRDPAAAPETVCDPYPGTEKGDMLPSFVKHILDGAPADVAAQEVFDAMAVSLAIEESLATRAPVSVRYVNVEPTGTTKQLRA